MNQPTNNLATLVRSSKGRMPKRIFDEAFGHLPRVKKSRRHYEKALESVAEAQSTCIRDAENLRSLLRVCRDWRRALHRMERVMQQERMMVALVCMRRKKIKGYKYTDVCKYILDFI